MLKGTVYLAQGCEKNVFVFVPNDLLSPIFNLQEFIDSGWGSLNNELQQIPRGSHVLPDLTREAPKEDSENYLQQLQNHMAISATAEPFRGE